VQLLAEKLPPPLTLDAQPLTEPVGVIGLALLSVTVAVQAVDALTATGLAVQLTDVVVLCIAPTTLSAAVALLPEWSS
jgi:hypothetical protein